MTTSNVWMAAMLALAVRVKPQVNDSVTDSFGARHRAMVRACTKANARDTVPVPGIGPAFVSGLSWSEYEE